MKFDVLGQVNKFAKCTCCLLIGLSCEIFAEEHFSGFEETTGFVESGSLQFSSTTDTRGPDKVMSLSQAFFAVMVQDGVQAFGADGMLTSPGTRAGFVIQRENTDIALKFRF